MISVYLIMCFVGGLLMFFLRKFPPAQKQAKKIGFPIDCNLCLGFWTYLILSFVFGVNVLEGIYYYPVFSEVVTAAVTSFVVHLVIVGWNSEYRILQVD